MCPRGLPPSRCTSTGGCAPSARSAAAAASVFASTGGNAASARNAAAKASASTGSCAAPARSAVRRTPCTRCVAARARKRHWPALADAAAATLLAQVGSARARARRCCCRHTPCRWCAAARARRSCCLCEHRRRRSWFKDLVAACSGICYVRTWRSTEVEEFDKEEENGETLVLSLIHISEPTRPY